MEQFINTLPLYVVLILLVAGFVLLIKGADFFVDGAGSVAKLFKIPSMIIGLTIVAMGTSLPETSVSVQASMMNRNELAISNAIGSNIFNLMVVIGVCAAMVTIEVGAETIKRDIPISGLCAGLLLLLGVQGEKNMLGQIDGIILLVCFSGYILYLIWRTKKAIAQGKSVEIEGEDVKVLPLWKSLIFIVIGAAGIAFGGDITIDTACRIATDLGMSETLVGLTIVSIGTSLPELVTSIVAARKNEVGMALGNAIGSNIFNFLMVLGIASAISPINFYRANVLDIVVLLAFTMMVWLFAATSNRLDKKEGAVMLFMYAVYAIYIVVR